MLRIFIDFILKTALEWRVNLTVLRSKFKRIRPVWFLSCSDEVSIIAIMKPEECCRPQSRFFLCIHLHAVRESTENCVQICDFCQKFLGQPDEEPSFESIFVFSLWNIYALEKYPGVKKKIGFEDWLIRVSLIVLQILQLVSYQHFTENLELRDRMG